MTILFYFEVLSFSRLCLFGATYTQKYVKWTLALVQLNDSKYSSIECLNFNLIVEFRVINMKICLKTFHLHLHNVRTFLFWSVFEPGWKWWWLCLLDAMQWVEKYAIYSCLVWIKWHNWTFDSWTSVITCAANGHTYVVLRRDAVKIEYFILHSTTSTRILKLLALFFCFQIVFAKKQIVLSSLFLLLLLSFRSIIKCSTLFPI